MARPIASEWRERKSSAPRNRRRSDLNGIVEPATRTSGVITTAQGHGDSQLLLSAADAAALCSMSVRTWQRLKSEGRVPRPVRLGRSNRWRRDELERWVDAGCPVRREWDAMTNANPYPRRCLAPFPRRGFYSCAT